MLERARAPHHVPDLARVVVAVDASGARGADDTGADSTGIVVAAKGSDGRAYILADLTLRGSPETWGRVAVKAYHYYNCDRLVAERNFGGSMIEHVIRTIDPNISFKEVTASRGKVQRAEPVSALYERGMVTHIGDLSALEQQMLAMTSQGYVGDGSPDRVDALVWAMSDLMVTAPKPQLVWAGAEPWSDLERARHHLSTDHYH
jgi:predicted phage terminase large subunit-like protein